MNQYYEYAPPIFRWIFGRTSITPNQMFPWIWWVLSLCDYFLSLLQRRWMRVCVNYNIHNIL